MDPAGPYFENVDPIVRLDPTDAVFVDAIHSDSDPILNLGKLLGLYIIAGYCSTMGKLYNKISNMFITKFINIFCCECKVTVVIFGGFRHFWSIALWLTP